MTLKHYKKLIDNLVKRGHGDLQVVYSCDDEGNRYSYVLYAPDVQNAADLELGGRMDPANPPKVVCIN